MYGHLVAAVRSLPDPQRVSQYLRVFLDAVMQSAVFICMQAE